MMKVVLNRQRFLEAFSLAASATDGRSKEVIGHVFLNAGHGVLEGTNGETSLCVHLGEPTNTSGAVLLNPQRIGAILKESRSESVTIETEGSSLEVSTSEGSYELQTANADAFPRMASIDASSLDVPAKGLLRGLQRVDFATDVDSTRYQLGGVNFVAIKDSLELVATDGRRMSYYALDTQGGPEFQGIVPVRPMGLVKRSLDDCEGFVGVAMSNSSVEFRLGSVTIQTRLVEGRYPNWQSIIPVAEGIRFGFLAGPFLQAVKQAAITADQESRGVLFSFADGTCRIAAKTADIGQSNVSVLVEGSESIALTMDHLFIRQWLQSLEPTENVEVFFKDPSRPSLWMAGDCKYVVMPMERK
jgi:DNA polymerase-3 subunit beta